MENKTHTLSGILNVFLALQGAPGVRGLHGMPGKPGLVGEIGAPGAAGAAGPPGYPVSGMPVGWGCSALRDVQGAWRGVVGSSASRLQGPAGLALHGAVNMDCLFAGPRRSKRT